MNRIAAILVLIVLVVLIKKKQADITAILLAYGVPLLDDSGEPIRP